MSTFTYAYYPGCSAMGTSAEYEASTRALCSRLGITLVEIPDWNCCGSTPAHATDHTLAGALVARNLMLAEQMPDVRGIITPCPSCLKNLKTTQHRLQRPAYRAGIEALLDYPVQSTLPVKSVLQVIAEDFGPQRVQEHVTRPLTGMKVAPYYGCLMSRPPDVMAFDDHENPVALDGLLAALGATVVPYAMKVDCCGASLALTRRDIVTSLSCRLLDAAVEAGAHAMATACPMCQMNLDMRQQQINRDNGTQFHMPVFYYTQLVGLATGYTAAEMGLDKLCVSPAGALACITPAAGPDTAPAQPREAGA
jgi:heterodisulfide reductase subunit B